MASVTHSIQQSLGNFAKMVQGNFLASDNGWALYDIVDQDAGED